MPLLRDLAKAEKTDQDEVIRRALALYQYVHQEAVENKRKLRITVDQDTIIKELVFR